VRNNSSSGTGGDGGGLYFYSGGTARNCLVDGNYADNGGGGIYVRSGAGDSVIGNCTVVSNASEHGGGIYAYGGTNWNSIIYGNTSTIGANQNWSYGSGTTSVYVHCCTTPLPTHDLINCITNNPQFVGGDNYQLTQDSPCINIGTNQPWMGSAVDLRDTSRILEDIVELGAYEYFGAPFVEITNKHTIVSNTVSYIDIGGTNNAWVVGDMGWTNAANGASGTLPVSGLVSAISLNYGENRIEVFGSNTVGDVASDSVVIFREVPEDTGDSPVHYVALDGAAVWPYTNWTDATPSIQDAVDAAASNDTVLITNGTYVLNLSVFVTNTLTIRSVNGPNHTVVDGNAADRCFNLSIGDILLEGLTITNGLIHDDQSGGGGVLCASADQVLSSCYIVGNVVAKGIRGGGVRGGTLYNCLIKDNDADGNGGGAYNSTLYNCTITGNHASSGDGVYDCTLTACIVWGNIGTDMELSSAMYTCASDGVTHGQYGNITNNPQFVSGSDFHLAASSPCIDAGVNLDEVKRDLDGTPRPLDSDANGTASADIGCYEFLNTLADSDGDGLSDGDEVGTHGRTEPTQQTTTPTATPSPTIRK